MTKMVKIHLWAIHFLTCRKVTTNYHKQDDLNKQTFTLSQFWRPEPTTKRLVGYALSQTLGDNLGHHRCAISFGHLSLELGLVCTMAIFHAFFLSFGVASNSCHSLGYRQTSPNLCLRCHMIISLSVSFSLVLLKRHQPLDYSPP